MAVLELCGYSEMAQDLFFQMIDLIPDKTIKEWLQYLPPNNSLSNSRVYHEVYDDDTLPEDGESIGSQIWLCIRDSLPTSYGDDLLIGRSRRVRFIRELCRNSLLFPKHYDEMESPYPLETYSNYEITAQLTILVYLNDGFSGGNAIFYLHDREYCQVTPRAGRVVIFDRRILHSAEPLLSQDCDKLFLKCCAFYGREKEASVAVAKLPELSSITASLQSFKNATQIQNKKGFAIKICNYLVTERSNDVFRDPESGIQQVFFVVCYLLQSSVKEERLLAYRTLECFPRKEFLDSDLALLLGETLLRDSMDSDPLIASNGIKGIFLYSRNIDYSASYIKSWLCHPLSIIRESCLVGLLDLMSRYHYGVELQYERKVSHDLSKNFWASFVPFVPLIESFCFDETENNREVEILREKSFQILELCPLLLDPTTDST